MSTGASPTGAGTAAGREPQRPRRADARRNRARVLDAAADLFSSTGRGMRIEDVATAAGVGVGTVCRHFPTKADLLGAVLDRLYADLAADARRTAAGDDPATAFAAFAERMADAQAQRRVLTEMAPDTDLPRDPEVTADLRSAVATLVADAQAAGAVRHDVSATDVLLLLAGVAQVTTIAEDLEPGVRRRYVAVMLDGLRPSGASPLPGRPLTTEDLDQMIERRRSGGTPTSS